MPERRPLAISAGHQTEIGDGDTLDPDLVPPSDDATAARSTPTWVPAETTYRIPVDTQLLTIAPVKCDGLLIIDGTLILAEAGVCCTDIPSYDGSVLEEVLVRTATVLAGVVIPTGSVVANLRDNINSTRVVGIPLELVGIRFDPLAQHYGRSIAVVSIHAHITSSLGVVMSVGAVNLPSVNLATDTQIVDVEDAPIVGAFRKSDLTAWTNTEVDALVCTLTGLNVFNAFVSLTRLSLIAVYGSGTEVARIAGLDSYEGTPAGVTASNAGVLTAMRDTSDLSYLSKSSSLIDIRILGASFDPLVSTDGRYVVAFYLVVRFLFGSTGLSSSGSEFALIVDNFDGITPTPSLMRGLPDRDYESDLTLGPFTKGGEQTWSPEEFATMTCDLTFVTSNNIEQRMIKVSVLAVYT